METNDDFSTLFFGADYTKRMAKFKNDLLEIENRHIEYFKGRPARNKDHEPHDFLHNHYHILTTPPNIMFKIDDASDLDIQIQNECHQAFRDNFEKTQ